MRTDAKKNLQKVAGAALKDPLATEREIAKRAGVSNGTAHNMLGKLEQEGVIEKNTRTVEICERDLLLVEKSQGISDKWMNNFDGDEKVLREDALAASRISEISQKRYSLLGSDLTDKDGKFSLEHLSAAKEALGEYLDIV